MYDQPNDIKLVLIRVTDLFQTSISKYTGVLRCAVQALLKNHKETFNLRYRCNDQLKNLSAIDEKHTKFFGRCLIGPKNYSNLKEIDYAKNIIEVIALPPHSPILTSLCLGVYGKTRCLEQSNKLSATN